LHLETPSAPLGGSSGVCLYRSPDTVVLVLEGRSGGIVQSSGFEGLGDCFVQAPFLFEGPTVVVGGCFGGSTVLLNEPLTFQEGFPLLFQLGPFAAHRFVHPLLDAAGEGVVGFLDYIVVHFHGGPGAFLAFTGWSCFEAGHPGYQIRGAF
jgi:hypothetical protein